MAQSQRHLRSVNKNTSESGGMQDGRKKAFIEKNGYPVNHTATIRPDSGMYRECETCPLKFR